MKKKLLSLLLIFVMATQTVGCGEEGMPSQEPAASDTTAENATASPEETEKEPESDETANNEVVEPEQSSQAEPQAENTTTVQGVPFTITNNEETQLSLDL